jgi:hypothetical protein
VRGRGDNRRSAGSGTAAHAGRDEHHVGTRQMFADLLDDLLGGGAADLGSGRIRRVVI